MSGRYTPTMGMVRELATAKLGLRSEDEVSRERCIRRGLLTHNGVTVEGQRVLTRIGRQFEAHGHG